MRSHARSLHAHHADCASPCSAAAVHLICCGVVALLLQRLGCWLPMKQLCSLIEGMCGAGFVCWRDMSLQPVAMVTADLPVCIASAARTSLLHLYFCQKTSEVFDVKKAFTISLWILHAATKQQPV
jgi:hypothetical protein